MGVSRHLYCDKTGNIEGMAAATIFYDISEESQLRAVNLMGKWFVFLSFSAYNFLTIMDISLHIDLVLTLKKPFAKTGNRYIISIGTAFVVGIAGGAAQVHAGNHLTAFNLVLFYSTKVIFFMSAFYSLSLAAYSFM